MLGSPQLQTRTAGILLQDEEGWKKSGQSEDVVFHERKPTVPAAWRVVHGKRKRVVDGGKFGTV